MTEELKQKAIENVCKRNPLVAKEWFIDAFKKYDKGKKVKYLKDCEIAEYEAYLAGATENGIQWHDLRKDPNDLPKGYQENTKFLCSDTEGKTLMLIRYGSFWQGNIDIIAWCENPQFKE